MAFRHIVVAIAVFVTFAVGGVAAYSVADAGQDAAAQESATVEDEEIVQQTGVWQFVDKATEDFTTGFSDENVTVRNQDGQELTRGEDYEWNATDGTIKFIDTENVEHGETGSIDYDYRQNTEEVQGLLTVLSSMISGLGLVAVFAGGIALVVLLIAFGALIAKVFGNDGVSTGR